MAEFIAGLSILTIIFVFGFSACTGSNSMVLAREAEVKANIHSIQVALQRYMTDNNEYPAYLLGGDRQGWDNWHIRFDGVNTIIMSENRVASNAYVHDPLIAYNYLSDYPKNPFTSDPRAVIARTSMAGSGQLGDGDPRFGYLGKTMGQGLDDMNLFRGANHPGQFFWSQVETRRTLDRGNWMYVPEEFKKMYPVTTDMYYLFGGMIAPGDDEVVRTWWPGNFLYKATSDRQTGGRSRVPVPNTNFGGHYNRYILGGYGDLGTEGLDIIRLVYFDSTGKRLSWQCPPGGGRSCFDLGYEPFRGGFGESGGLPEVFGGGDGSTGPSTPYDGGTGDPAKFMYGAPDGITDGVILVLTNGSGIGSEFVPAEEDGE